MLEYKRALWPRGLQLALAGLIIVGFGACGDSGPETMGVTSAAGGPARQDMKASADMAPAMVMEQGVSASAQVKSPRPGVEALAETETPLVMMIREGNASVKVKSVDKASIEVKALVLKVGGQITNSQLQGGKNNVKSATFEAKVPAERYEEAVDGLGSIGEVEAVNTSVIDVGEEYVDVTARIENAKRLEQRLVELLATRTGRLEDVLAVERELARVREEIERAEGRRRYLRNRAALSTLSINIHESEPILGRPAHNPLIEAFKQAWRNFVRLATGFIASLGVLVPLVLILLGIYVLWRKISKKMPK